MWPQVRHDEPEAYCHRILRNVVVSTWRKDRRLVLVEEVRDSASATAPSAPAAGRDGPGAVADRLDLVRALQSLPAREREVVVLRHYADLSERAVAEAARGLRRHREELVVPRASNGSATLMSDQGEAHVR